MNFIGSVTVNKDDDEHDGVIPKTCYFNNFDIPSPPVCVTQCGLLPHSDAIATGHIPSTQAFLHGDTSTCGP